MGEDMDQLLILKFTGHALRGHSWQKDPKGDIEMHCKHEVYTRGA